MGRCVIAETSAAPPQLVIELHPKRRPNGACSPAGRKRALSVPQIGSAAPSRPAPIVRCGAPPVYLRTMLFGRALAH
jgi:hypothetical protein